MSPGYEQLLQFFLRSTTDKVKQVALFHFISGQKNNVIMYCLNKEDHICCSVTTSASVKRHTNIQNKEQLGNAITGMMLASDGEL